MTSNKKAAEKILPSYCYPAGQWYGKAAEQPWKKSDSVILICSLLAMGGFIAFILAYTATF